MGANESITQTIEKRKYKCFTKAGKLATKAEDDRMLALVRLVGGYQTNVQFHHSTNLDAFTGKTKQHIKSPKNLSGHNVRRVL